MRADRGGIEGKGVITTASNSSDKEIQYCGGTRGQRIPYESRNNE